MESQSNIYLGADGGYHDDTEENREKFPAADDTAPEESGTLTEQGTDAGSGGTPVTTEPAPDAQPGAKAPKDSTK